MLGSGSVDIFLSVLDAGLVGGGVNDAGALAQADVGFTLGSGYAIMEGAADSPVSRLIRVDWPRGRRRESSSCGHRDLHTLHRQLPWLPPHRVLSPGGCRFQRRVYPACSLMG
jgi:hypothetical protein